MKPMRGKKAHRDDAGRSDADDGAGPAAIDAPLTPEERARLLAELEAELAEAERSIAEEGTISAEEFRKLREAYWLRIDRGEDDAPIDPQR